MFAASFAQLPTNSTITNYGASYNLVSSTFGIVRDTVGSSGNTHYLQLPAQNSGFYKTCSINLVDSNLTGTTTLTATLQHSIDGKNWFGFINDSSFSISGTSSVGWTFNDYADAQIRIKVVSGATGTTKIQGTARLKSEVIKN